MEFEVAHRLFLGMVSSPSTKDAQIEAQWHRLVDKTTKTNQQIPEATIELFSKEKPELARKFSIKPA